MQDFIDWATDAIKETIECLFIMTFMLTCGGLIMWLVIGPLLTHSGL